MNRHNWTEGRQRSGRSDEYELHVNALTGPETNVEDVFFAGIHCGNAPVLLRTLVLLFTDTLSDAGGGSVKNGQYQSRPHSPSVDDQGMSQGRHWDHFRHPRSSTNTDSITKAPEVLLPATLQLVRPDSAELQGCHHLWARFPIPLGLGQAIEPSPPRFSESRVYPRATKVRLRRRGQRRARRCGRFRRHLGLQNSVSSLLFVTITDDGQHH